MTLVTLQRRAPVAPDLAACRLCHALLAGTFQDHLLVGQPGTAGTRAVICEQCGDAIAGLVELCGADLRLLVNDVQSAPKPKPAGR
jgi:hypothetical protein